MTHEIWFKSATVAAIALSVCGCTTTDVMKVDARAHHPSQVCIERNDRVQVADFVSVVERGFLRHGIETTVYDRAIESCAFVLTYTATRGWDLKPFMNFAELRLKHQGKTIGTALYKHSGGFGLNKWASTETKMTPVIDELLADFTR